MPRTLVSIGAGIILLSLPFDVVFQQMVSYSAVLTSLSSATIAKTTFCDLGSNGPFSIPPFDTHSTAPFQCPTGDCIYDLFHTLVLDHRCHQLDNSITFRCYTPQSNQSNSPERALNYSSCGWYVDIRAEDPLYKIGANYIVGDVFSSLHYVFQLRESNVTVLTCTRQNFN